MRAQTASFPAAQRKSYETVIEDGKVTLTMLEAKIEAELRGQG